MKTKNKKVWMPEKSKKTKVKLTDFEKEEISSYCQPLVELFKKKMYKRKP